MYSYGKFIIKAKNEHIRESSNLKGSGKMFYSRQREFNIARFNLQKNWDREYEKIFLNDFRMTSGRSGQANTSIPTGDSKKQ